MSLYERKEQINVQIGGRIRIAREAAGYTQEHFAELIDVSVQYTSDLERGVVGTSIPTLIKICEALHVSSDYLLFGRTSENKGEASQIASVLMTLTPEQLAIVHKAVRVTLEAFRCAD